jgi:hypothetical protein
MKLSNLIYTTTCLVALSAGTAWAVGNVGVSSNAGTNRANVGTSISGNWNSQNQYWQNNYSMRPYYKPNRDYSSYEPAYRYGVELYDLNPGRRYDDLDQTELRRGWNQSRGNSSMSWDDAREAARDAYNRMDYEPHGLRPRAGTAFGYRTSRIAFHRALIPMHLHRPVPRCGRAYVLPGAELNPISLSKPFLKALIKALRTMPASAGQVDVSISSRLPSSGILVAN